MRHLQRQFENGVEVLWPSKVAAALEVTTNTLWRWRRDGIGPICFRPAGKEESATAPYLYPKKELEAWKQQHMSTRWTRPWTHA